MTTPSRSNGKVLDVRIALSVPTGGSIFADSSNLSNFSYINKINELPMGKFTVADNNNSLSTVISGYEGLIIFRNTEDDANDTKSSAIPFVITDVTRAKSGAIPEYEISWVYGNHLTLQCKHFIAKGNSVDAIKAVASQFNDTFTDNITTNKIDLPTDTMTWRFVYDEFKDALAKVINNSYAKNDYLFWYVDDVNSARVISSFNSEYSTTGSNLFVYDVSTNSDISNTVVNITNPPMKKWLYSNYSPNDITGANLNKLFPAVVLSGTPTGDVVTSNCDSSCFSSIISTSGDTSQSDIATKLNLTLPIVYPPSSSAIKPVRYYPNNSHKMYALAPTFREYKYATYVKTITIVLKNVIGPRLGTVCSILCNSNTAQATGDTTWDTITTGNYILVSRAITYDANKLSPTTIKPTANAYVEFVTVLEFISNDVNNKDFDYVLNLYKQIKPSGK